MKKLLSVIAVMMFVFLSIVPAQAAGNTVVANQTLYVNSVNGGAVRVRALPNTNSDILDTLGVGRPVKMICAFNDEWIEISYMVKGVVKQGFMMNKYLTEKDPAASAQTFRPVQDTFQVKVLTAGANGVVSLWNDTTKNNCDKIRDLGRNEILQVLSASHAWYLVCTADGQTGYVAKAYVTK